MSELVRMMMVLAGSVVVPSVFVLVRKKRGGLLWAGWWAAWQAQGVVMLGLAGVYLLTFFSMLEEPRGMAAAALIWGAVLVQSRWVLKAGRMAVVVTRGGEVEEEKVRRFGRSGLLVGVATGLVAGAIYAMVDGRILDPGGMMARVLAATGVALVILVSVLIGVGSLALLAGRAWKKGR